MYRVLFVEKDKAFMDLATTFLTRINKDIRAIPCDDAKDVPSYLEKYHIDVIVSDHSPPEGIDGLSLFKSVMRQNTNYPFILMVRNGSEEMAVEAMNLGVNFYLMKGKPPLEFFTDLVDKIILAAERRRIVEERSLNERRLSALVKLAKMHNYSFSEVAHFVLEENVKLTGSTMGYFALYDEKRDLLTMYAWSQGGMRECRIEDKPIEYPMDTVGIWGEPVRQKRAIILNDYSAPNPLKKGTPKGHVELKRLLMVPLMYNGMVIGAAGVANKEHPYDNTDLTQMNLLMDGMASIYMGRMAGEARYETERRYEEMLQYAPIGIMVVDNQGLIIECNRKARELLDEISGDGHIGKGLIEYKSDFTVQLYSAVMDSIQTKSPSTLKLHFSSNHRTSILKASIQPTFKDKDTVRGAIISLEDMSDIEDSLEKLERASFQLNVIDRVTFLEVSNQLQIINGYVNFLKSMIDDATLADHLDCITEAITKIQAAMRFSRDFRNVGIMNPEWQRVSDVASQAALAVGVPEGMLTINTGNLEILADPQLSKVFENLMRRSLKDETVSAIKIGFSITDGRMIVVYEDNGKGVPEEQKNMLFDGRSAMSINGMYLVKEVLDVTNLTIVETGRPGEGSRYEIIIPTTNYRLRS